MSSPPRTLDRALAWPQFSIRDVLMTMLVVAIGLTLYRLQQVWPDSLRWALTLLSVAVVISLAVQVRDFCRELRSEKHSRDARWGLRFAIASRLTAMVLLATYHISYEKCAWEVPEVRSWLGIPGWPILIHYCIALVIVIGGTRQLVFRRRAGQRNTLRIVGYGVLAFLGSVVLSYLLAEWLRVHFLVHKAVTNVETQILVSQGIDVPAATRAEPAFWLGVATVALVPLNYVLIYLSACQSITARRRKMARVAFAVVFPAFVGMFLWNYFVALPQASPFLATQAPDSGMWHIMLIGVPCFLVVTTAIAYRWSVRRETIAPQNPEEDTTFRGPYLHERRWFLAILATALIMHIALTHVFLIDHFRGSTWELMMSLLTYDEGTSLGAAAVSLVAVQAVCAHWRRRRWLPPAMPPQLPPGRFVATWCAVAATTLITLPVLAIYGFALCLAPWYF